MNLPPALSSDSWGEDDNARRYDAFAREYPNYSETSRDLIASAQPSTDAVVVDLACGTGVTTREILAVLGPHGQVIGVDQSAAMLEVAASSSATDPRVTWIQAPAEHVDQHLAAPADLVICNSAIWQTSVLVTAKAVRAILKHGGLFTFNVPVGFLDEPGEPGGRYPPLLAEMRAIAERDYGWTPPEPAPASPSSGPSPTQRLTRESIRQSLITAGLHVEPITEATYQDSAESQRAWLSIPIFTKGPLPGLPYPLRLRLLDQACQRLGPGQPEQGQWIIFTARLL